MLQSIDSFWRIRQYGGHFFIITQSIPGLESAYGEPDRRALLAGAGVQIYMTPQDDRTAQVLSDALGNRTTISTTRSQSVIRRFSESGNVSRRSEERPLIYEILRFPLDRVLILPEGQYPIMAHHIRFYMDHHFKGIYAARVGHSLPYPPLTEPAKRSRRMGPAQTSPARRVTPEEMEAGIEAARNGFAALGDRSARTQRPTPSSAGGRAAPVRRAGELSSAEVAARFSAEVSGGATEATEPQRPTPAARVVR